MNIDVDVIDVDVDGEILDLVGGTKRARNLLPQQSLKIGPVEGHRIRRCSHPCLPF